MFAANGGLYAKMFIQVCNSINILNMHNLYTLHSCWITLSHSASYELLAVYIIVKLSV